MWDPPKYISKEILTLKAKKEILKRSDNPPQKSRQELIKLNNNKRKLESFNETQKKYKDQKSKNC